MAAWIGAAAGAIAVFRWLDGDKRRYRPEPHSSKPTKSPRESETREKRPKHIRGWAPKLRWWPGGRADWIEERDKLVKENERLANDNKFQQKTIQDLQGQLKDENLQTNPHTSAKDSDNNQGNSSEAEHPFIAMARDLSPNETTDLYTTESWKLRDALCEKREKLEDEWDESDAAHERLAHFDTTCPSSNDEEYKKYRIERRELCRHGDEEYRGFQRTERELLRMRNSCLRLNYTKARAIALIRRE